MRLNDDDSHTLSTPCPVPAGVFPAQDALVSHTPRQLPMCRPQSPLTWELIRQVKESLWRGQKVPFEEP